MRRISVWLPRAAPISVGACHAAGRLPCAANAAAARRWCTTAAGPGAEGRPAAAAVLPQQSGSAAADQDAAGPAVPTPPVPPAPGESRSSADAQQLEGLEQFVEFFHDNRKLFNAMKRTKHPDQPGVRPTGCEVAKRLKGGQPLPEPVHSELVVIWEAFTCGCTAEQLQPLALRGHGALLSLRAHLTDGDSLVKIINPLVKKLAGPASFRDLVRQALTTLMKNHSGATWKFSQGPLSENRVLDGDEFMCVIDEDSGLYFGSNFERMIRVRPASMVSLVERLLRADTIFAKRHRPEAESAVQPREGMCILQLLKMSLFPLILGDSGSGKTFAAMQLALAIGCDIALLVRCNALWGTAEKEMQEKIGEVGEATFKDEHRPRIALQLGERVGAVIRARLEAMEVLPATCAGHDVSSVRVAFIADEIGSMPLVAATLATCMGGVLQAAAARIGGPKGKIEVKVIGAGTGARPDKAMVDSRTADFHCVVLRPLGPANTETILGASLYSKVLRSDSPARGPALLFATNPRGALLLQVADERMTKLFQQSVPSLASMDTTLDFGSAEADPSPDPDFRSVSLVSGFDRSLDAILLHAVRAFRLLNGLSSMDYAARMSAFGVALYVSECYARGQGHAIRVLDEREWQHLLVHGAGLLAPTQDDGWCLPGAQGVALAAEMMQVPWFGAGGDAAERAVASSLWMKLAAVAAIDLSTATRTAAQSEAGLAELQTHALELLLSAPTASSATPTAGSPAQGRAPNDAPTSPPPLPFRWAGRYESRKAIFSVSSRVSAQRDWRMFQEFCSRTGVESAAYVVANASCASGADLFVIVPPLRRAWAIQVKAYAPKSLPALQGKVKAEVDKLMILGCGVGPGYSVRPVLCVIVAPDPQDAGRTGAAPGDSTKRPPAAEKIRSAALEHNCDFIMVGDGAAATPHPLISNPLWPVDLPHAARHPAGQANEEAASTVAASAATGAAAPVP